MITFPEYGDIYIFDFNTVPGSVTAGKRPAVILQTDEWINHEPAVIIAPISFRYKQTFLINHVVLGKRFGLKKDSMILLEEMQTVDQSKLGRYIGHITEEHLLRRIDQGIKRVLELRSKPYVPVTPVAKVRKRKKKRFVYDQRDVMCLCPVCKNTYRHRGYRLISVPGTKETCDLCNHRQGFDYAVVGLLSRPKT
ncbi:MAG: type II toxin-antitoxin system PemK/MazF family toxin [Clostridiales bacterium]|nr:type II toxin-antitoxin system PemK/MazF family toxin [Clostridiales bacterium]